MTIEVKADEPRIDKSATEQTVEALEKLETGRSTGPRLGRVIGTICVLWTLFQLWIASPFPFTFGVAIISGVPARAVHLAFGLMLAFLIFPARKSFRDRRIPWSDIEIGRAHV